VQKQAFTQIRAGSEAKQPHIVLFPSPLQSLSVLHSL
jgi:hypothetical protein